MKRILVAISCILLSACATSMPNKAAMVQEINRETVKELNCNLVRKISITTDTRGRSFAAGIDYAKELAREDAAAMGATHILWVSAARGFITNVEGEAYYCNKSKNP